MWVIWQFVMWGFMHGAYLAVERALGRENPDVDNMSAGALMLRRLVIFHCIALTWLPFRSDDIGMAKDYFVQLFSFSAGAVTGGMLLVVAIAISALVVQWMSDRRDVRDLMFRLSVPGRAFLYSCVGVSVVIANAKGAQPFIYFQF